MVGEDVKSPLCAFCLCRQCLECTQNRRNGGNILSKGQSLKACILLHFWHHPSQKKRKCSRKIALLDCQVVECMKWKL